MKCHRWAHELCPAHTWAGTHLLHLPVAWPKKDWIPSALSKISHTMGKYFQQRQQCILIIWTVCTCFFRPLNWCLLSAYDCVSAKRLISCEAQWVKNPPAAQEMQQACIRSLGWEDALEEALATILAFLPGEPTDRGAWGATVHRVEKSQEQLTDWAHIHIVFLCLRKSTPPFTHRNKRKTIRL